MAVDFIQKSAGNSASTTLSSSVINTDTSVPLTSDSAFLSGGGFVLIDEGLATEELAYYTGKSGSSLTIPLANRGLEGGSAQAHASGATVKGVFSADMWNNLCEAILNLVVVTTGALDTTKVVDLTTAQVLTNKTLTSPVIRAFDGWQDAAETWTYASVDAPTGVITVPTDATTKYSVGMRVKFTQTTVKYGIITAIAATSMTIYTGTDYTLTNAAISANYYSAQYAPLGFPTSPAKWTVTTTDTSSRTQGTPSTNTWYNLGSVTISVPIGVWNTSYSVIGFVQNTGAATDHSLKVTLSTANNSESDSTTTAWHTWRFASAAQFLNLHMSKSFLITAAAKTSYYLNTATGDTETTIGNSNNSSALIIKAVCAYL